MKVGRAREFGPDKVVVAIDRTPDTQADDGKTLAQINACQWDIDGAGAGGHGATLDGYTVFKFGHIPFDSCGRSGPDPLKGQINR